MRLLSRLGNLAICLALVGCGKSAPAPKAEGGANGGDGGGNPKPQVDYQKKFDELMVELKHKAPGRRANAIVGIVEFKDEAIPYLIGALSDKGVSETPAQPGQPGSTREAAVIALQRIGPAGEKALINDGLPVLLGGLLESNAAVLEHTIAAIGQIGPKAKNAGVDIAKHISSTNDNVRRAAYDALTRIQNTPLEPVLALLTNPEPKVAADAARALSSIRPLPKDAIGTLIYHLKVDPSKLPDADEYKFVRDEIADALASFGEQAKEAVPALVELLRSTKEEDFNKHFRPRSGSDESPAMIALRRIGKPAVAEVSALLDSPQGFVRWQAARVLGGIGPDARDALPALKASFDKELTRGEMAHLGAYITLALAQAHLGADAGPIVAKLAELLSHKEEPVRLETLRALARFGRKAESAVMAIIPLLDDKQEMISAQAADTLRVIGPAAKVAVPALAKKLADPDLNVRRNALKTIRSFGAVVVEVVPELIKLLSDMDEAFRREAVEVIASIGPPAKAAVSDLTKLLKSEDDREKTVVLQALAAIGPDAASAGKEIVPIANGKDRDLRTQALETLGRIGNTTPEVLNAITVRFKDDFMPVRIAAVRALAVLGPGAKDAAPTLKAFAAASAKYPNVALWSAVALYRMGSDAEANLKQIVAAIRNLEPAGNFARLEAIDAAEYLGDGVKAILPDLIAALDDHTPIRRGDKTPVRLRAVVAIGKLNGPIAKDAVPKLSNMLKESDATLKRAALETLGQIGPAATFALPRLREIIRNEPEFAEQAQATLDRIEAKP